MKLSKQLTGYQSEFTKFLTEMKQKNPALESDQREGRNLLWDKPPIDLDDIKRDDLARVKQQAYVYQSK
ncbi:DUF3460 family protein [Lacisediminimonas sp.]|uniref:DUF3460 family protein n=1 Tax=Lacisediminimonas sp. TaxID=3060582 RepID=UPI0027263295|nr:DUF3460 family protein [Lacisediminimonas sp.]MDO8298324.1 DUF3460 family protein [Lacisediminimonas sp.]